MKAGEEEDLLHGCGVWIQSEQPEPFRRNMSGHVTEQSYGTVTDDVDLGLQSDLRPI